MCADKQEKRELRAFAFLRSGSGASGALRAGSGTRDGVRTGFFHAAFTSIAVALIACLLAIPSGALAAALPDATELTMQERAPDFVVKDLRGRPFRLSDHKGKRPVLIIFSTTWCNFCQAEIPHFKSIYSTYAKQGVEIVNVDIRESKEQVSRFAAKYELPYRVLLDEEGTVSSFYGVRGVPTMVLIDKNGMIVCRQCRSVEPLLESLLKK